MIYAGTSGWAYPAWKPDFYPAKLAAAKFLGYYASRLNSVELNYTFRRFPTEKLQAGWIAATPPEFRFAVKAHQSITHVKRLRDAQESTARFLGALAPFRAAGRLGPVLFQLPPHLPCDVPLLGDFLAALPRGERVAFEFRHDSWFTDEVYDLLRASNAALCLADTETIETPDIHTADYAYLRLRKPSYDLDALAPWVASLARGGDVFLYFKHEETPEGAYCAERLLQS